MSEAESEERFKIFPFYNIVCEGTEDGSKDLKRHLTAFIRAAELLETFCVNLFLYPWKKEIKTVKTFTGPFVYGLLPVLSNATIQSVLASIGYLPHADSQHSHYRLSEEADPDRAALVGFELLLARVECRHLLEMWENAPPCSQGWPDAFWERAGRCSNKVSQGDFSPVEKSKTGEEGVEEKGGEEEEEEKEKEEEEAAGKLSRSGSLLEPGQALEETPEEPEVLLGEVHPSHCSQTARPVARQIGCEQVFTANCNLLSDDRSIMEMQWNYPDLAIRGRRLLLDKKHRAAGHTNGSGATASLTASDCDRSGTAAGEVSAHTGGGLTANAYAVDAPAERDASGTGSGSARRAGSCRRDGGAGDGCPAGGASSHGSELSGPQAISIHAVERSEGARHIEVTQL